MTDRAAIRMKGRVLAQETAIALGYNAETQAVMMASPRDLEDFAIGFSVAEGIVDRADQIEELEVVHHDTGIELRMLLEDTAAAALAARRRSMTGPVGCGLCGIDSLEQALRPLPRLPVSPLRLTPAAIHDALDAMQRGQSLHDQTHAVHAAGFMTPTDGLLTLREDVGRHNALDKLIGALIRASRPPAEGAVLITSRVSVDIVQKTVMAGAPALIAVSAPTARAVHEAEAAGLTLIANAKGGSFVAYTDPNGILEPEDSHVA